MLDKIDNKGLYNIEKETDRRNVTFEEHCDSNYINNRLEQRQTGARKLVHKSVDTAQK